LTKASHVIVGSLTAVGLGYDPVLAILGSIAPDFDVFLAKVFGTWKGNKRRRLFTAHRGFSHHAVLIPLTLIFSFSGKFMGAFFLGYFLHLICDLLTPLGLPYKFSYYPRISLKLFKTGSLEEFAVVGFYGLFLVFFSYFSENGKEVVYLYLSKISQIVSYFF